MSIQIKLKNSVVQDSTPSTSDLPAVGEIALNANINSIGGFMRASNNSIVKIFGPGSLSTPTATTTVSGISELATNSETTTGTATNRVVTPAGLNAVTVAERTTSNTNYVAKAGSTMTGVLTATAGSNSAPAINFGDSDSGIFGGTNTVSLTAGGTTRLTADTGVSVVGTLAVTGAITSTSDLTIADKIIHAGDTNTAIRFPAADTVSVETAGTEAIRVDSLGHFLVGTSAARSPAGISAKFQVEGTDGNSSGISLTRNSADSGGSRFMFNKSRGATNGSDVVVQDGDNLGQILFCANDGTDSDSIAASISSTINGTPGSNDVPGQLLFSTTADGAASPTTRLTIDKGGKSTFAGEVEITGNFSVQGEIGLFNGATNAGRFIDAGLGDGNELKIRGCSGGDSNHENMIVATRGSGVDLLFDNSTKFFTITNGVQATNRIIVGEGTAQRGLLSGDANSVSVGSIGDLAFNFVRNSQIKARIDGNDFQIPTDNGKIELGADQDFLLFHDGSNSYIKEAGTGNVIVEVTDANIEFKKGGSEVIAKFIPDGACELYHNNVKRFETLSSGVKITGLNATGSSVLGDFRFKDQDDNLDVHYDAENNKIVFHDNNKATFGTADDLQIFHDSNNSIIADVGTGALILKSNQIDFVDSTSTEFLGRFFENSSTELYFDGSRKFNTKVDGVTVTGNLNLSAEINLTDGADANRFIDAGIGTNSLILRKTTGGDANHEELAKFVGDGRAELMFDGTAKLRTVTTGTELLGQADLTSTSNGALVEPLRLRNGGTGAGTNVGMQFFNGNGTSSGAGLLAEIQAIDVGNFDAELLFTTALKSGFSAGGCVERLKLTTTGATITGDQILTGNMFIGAELNLMSGSTNANRFIDSSMNDGNGLHVRSTQNGDANHENMAIFIRNGASELFFDNVKKLKTVSEGIKLTELQIAPSGTESAALVNFGGGGVVTNSNSYGHFFDRGTGGTNTTAIMFRSAGSQVGKIIFNNTSTLYQTGSSDRTVKKNFESWSETVLNSFKNLNPQKFNFIQEEDTDAKHKGYIAQDLAEKFPEAYPKDPETDKYGFNPSGMVVYLMKAIQELEAKVAALEAA